MPAERNLGVYALFVSFFPQLVAGPIERTKSLLPQLKAEHHFNYDQAAYGLKLMAWGYYKKLVVADNLAVYADTVFNDAGQYKGFAVVIAIICFTVQIYCDFSAYSDIARGTAKMLGIELMENFKSPYFSASVKEFWSRWHISLSTWFRDYVYIPMGGNRVSNWRHCWNLIAAFLLSGLWHGAKWTFLAWGGIHGAAQVIENAFLGRRKADRKKSRILSFFHIGLTFAFVALAWTFFRAQSIGDAVLMIRGIPDGIASPLHYLKTGFQEIEMGKRQIAALAFSTTLVFVYDYYSLKIDIVSRLGKLRLRVQWILYFCLISLIFILARTGEVSEFIYFQF